MITVLSGTVCVGFVLPRGKLGFEGFDAAEKSLGLFDTQSAAIEAAINAARNAS
jgi:hypothetical protein